MIFLLFSILCSVTVSIVLKLRKNASLSAIIGINYFAAAVWVLLALRPQIIPNLTVSDAPIFIALGILLPTVFIVMGKAVSVAGIAKADAAQRLSLFLPLAASFLFFGEAFNLSRMVILVISLLSLWLLGKNQEQKLSKSHILWLLGVWAGYGICDILLKQLSTANDLANRLWVMFVLAAMVMSIYWIVQKQKIKGQDILLGSLLGSLNFGNIYFYLHAHRSFAHSPTIVFTAMNLGVIVLATIMGVLFFHEKINKINILGLILAIAAIIGLYFQAA
ncbi:MAG: EamA family transporter [Neisseriaceae bacterium]|nr:EamA family transporter [Neisseriaceae bacterium]